MWTQRTETEHDQPRFGCLRSITRLLDNLAIRTQRRAFNNGLIQILSGYYIDVRLLAALTTKTIILSCAAAKSANAEHQ